MKKIWNKLMDILPMLWGCLVIAIITIGSIALLITVIKWLLTVMGVIA